MLKSVIIDRTIVNNCLEKCDFQSLANYLKNVFPLVRNEVDGTPLQYEFSREALLVLCDVLTYILTEPFSQSVNVAIEELFRGVRNYVINPDVQNFLLSENTFLKNTKCMMTNFHASVLDDTLQIILQFLINLIVLNEIGANRVFDIFSCNIFAFLKEKRVVYELTALLYNISLFRVLPLEFDIYVLLFELYQTFYNVEFLHFLLEKCLNYELFWSYYNNFDIKFRITTLEIVRQKQINGDKLQIHENGIKVLTDQFVNSGQIIFQTVTTNDSDLEPYEVSKLLEVVSALCADEDYLKLLQNDKDLLINSGVLLINIHKLGKENENYFSSIQTLTDVTRPGENICQHPAFGFKVDLIRIIGNLCWKNTVMQDLIREAELIPIIFDCCNLDARNPFIMQWVILAIRNICENNVKNQALIAEMNEIGRVSSAALEEMGLSLHSDGNKTLRTVPLERS